MARYCLIFLNSARGSTESRQRFRAKKQNYELQKKKKGGRQFFFLQLPIFCKKILWSRQRKKKEGEGGRVGRALAGRSKGTG